LRGSRYLIGSFRSGSHRGFVSFDTWREVGLIIGIGC